MPAGWVAGGAAIIGAGEGIASSNSGKGEQKFINGATNEAINDAADISKTPFTQYTGELAPGATPNQTAAGNLAASTAGANNPANPLYQKSEAAIDSANGTWDSATAKQYMNPFEDQVLGAQNRQFQSTEAANSLNEAKNHAFGTDRSAVQEGEAQADEAANVGNTMAKAYDTAFSNWNTNNQNKISAANAYASVGQDVTKMNGQDITNLLTTGNAQMIAEQTQDTANYNEFLRGQNWSATELQPLLQALGKGSVASNINTQPQAGAQIANSLLGLGSTLAGLYGGSGSNNSFNPSQTPGIDSSQTSLPTMPDYSAGSSLSSDFGSANTTPEYVGMGA